MNIKLILLQFVPNLGNKGDIVEVSKGYANNFLIAKGLGRKVAAADIERNLKEKEIRNAKIKEHLLKNKEIKDKLSNKRVSLKLRASSSGKLYAAISREDIVKTIRETYGFELPEDAIQLKSVKSLGLHSFKISLKDQGDVAMKLKVYDIKKST
ncbi:MAG: 50S ribosomal protein L9 [Patescibacteria group bacterium]